MSDQQRPQVERLVSVHPALHPSNTNIPVTPAAGDEGQDAYFDPRPQSPESPDRGAEMGSNTGGSSWNANSARGPANKRQGRANSPSEAAAGARTGEDLLRRLSLGGPHPQQPDLADVDPRAAHPSLNLSGNVISATFCVPYSIAHAPGCEWVLSDCR